MPDERLRDVARSVTFLSEARELWDRFDYRAAAAWLRDSERYWTTCLWMENVDRLAANHELIEAVRDAASKGEFSRRSPRT